MEKEKTPDPADHKNIVNAFAAMLFVLRNIKDIIDYEPSKQKHRITGQSHHDLIQKRVHIVIDKEILNVVQKEVDYLFQEITKSFGLNSELALLLIRETKNYIFLKTLEAILRLLNTKCRTISHLNRITKNKYRASDIIRALNVYEITFSKVSNRKRINHVTVNRVIDDTLEPFRLISTMFQRDKVEIDQQTQLKNLITGLNISAVGKRIIRNESFVRRTEFIKKIQEAISNIGITSFNITQVAKYLKIPRTTFNDMLKKYKIKYRVKDKTFYDLVEKREIWP